MTLRQIIGMIMVGGVITFFYIVTCNNVGTKAATLMWLLAIFLTAIIAVGGFLLTNT